MELKFQLTLRGHYGYPDGEFERSTIIASDLEPTVIDEIKEFARELREDIDRVGVLGEGYYYIDGENLIEAEVQPVLEINGRFFALEELEHRGL